MGNCVENFGEVEKENVGLFVIQFNSIQFNSIQFNSIQFNSIQFNMIYSNNIK